VIAVSPIAACATTDTEGARATTAPKAAAVESPWCTVADPEQVVPGTGACRVDADCQLSSYQPGCCTQACAPSAKGRADVLRAQKAEDCVAMNKGPAHCPAPAACQPSAFDATAAVCCKGACTTVRRRAS
jgi:hypothetical protein